MNELKNIVDIGRTPSSSVSPWSAVVTALIVLLAGAATGCKDVPLDHGSKSIYRDTVTNSEDVVSSDTIATGDAFVVTESVVRTRTSDGKTWTDTLVRSRSFPRELTGHAVVYAKTDGKTERRPIKLNPDDWKVFGADANYPREFRLQTVLPLGRNFPESEYGRHGLEALTINVPGVDFILKREIKLDRDPSEGRGAILRYQRRELITGAEVRGNVNRGSIFIDGVDPKRRSVTVRFEGVFFPSDGGVTAPVNIKVIFRLDY